MLEIGSKAPSTPVLDDTGKTVTLSDFIGSYIVLYTYPKDDTPGCTAEACSFRDQSKAITDSQAVILGISKDSVASHQKFKEKFHLNFTLLSDPDHKLIDALGAWGEKISYGKKSMGIIRSTFVFDPEGILIKVWPKVSPQSHGEEIAAYLKEV
ncbi:peroxiredoxin [Pleomorphochaeta sp. DL1XJH-081]|uniref:peroxiredoxin n=1 Tax=Pleomorphochaeta sp. DL1XJH-081 TaxID=3409690 RepID=UPI003BB4FD41